MGSSGQSPPTPISHRPYAMFSKTLLGVAIGYSGPEEHNAQAGKEQALAAGQRAVALDPNDERQCSSRRSVNDASSFELAA